MTTQSTELQMLEIFKRDAIERMRENEALIQSQRDRIEELEFHLGKCRDSAYQMFYATVGVLPIKLENEPKPKRAKK